MRTSGERMLTTHTGSLPRPDTLRGDGDQPADEAMLREAVATVVGQQVRAGVDIVGDGEFSKPSYATYVAERLTGFGGMSTPFVSREMRRYPGVTMRLASDPLIARTLMTPACVDRLGYRGQGPVERDIANLLAATEAAGAGEAFMTAASPGVISWFYENRFYPSHEEYVGALAEAMKPEYDAIHQAGIVLQLDCPDLALGFNGWRDQPDIDLHGHRRRMAVNIEALNHATRDIPPERMRMHVCWGNANAPHTGDVPLGDIIDVLLTARPAGLAFEAANPRPEHEWTVFEDVELPDGKILIPGVLDSTTNYVEHPELVAQRIGRYTSVVGWERVIAGSDCGFSSVVGLTPVDPQVTWEKLRAMANGARIASAALSGA